MADTGGSSCWICGSERVVPFKARNLPHGLTPESLRITDFHYGRTLALLRCTRCSFIFADGAEVGPVASLYEALEDPQYAETPNSRELQMRWILSVVRKASPGARTLLDIGAGTGLLVEEAARAGLDALGVEPSRHLAGMAAQNGRAVLQGVFPHSALSTRRFDIVALIDVIEHVTDPMGLLCACRQALAPGGVLVLVTPDAGSLAARIMRYRWWHFRVAHVGYFNRRSLRTALQSAGFTITRECHAKWFFRIRYIAVRLEQYLPVLGWINRAAPRCRTVNWLFGRAVTLNLHDSFFLILK
jgi:2-polyprenyl-3-methyl-5-hydroxy-6-metoxy-1,4-benzoquinol methylase